MRITVSFELDDDDKVDTEDASGLTEAGFTEILDIFTEILDMIGRLGGYDIDISGSL